MLSPKKKTKKTPKAKKGPKGIAVFNVFFLQIIKKMLTIAPRKNAKIKAKKISGKPSKKPEAAANFKSPKPMPLPRQIKKIKAKNKKAENPAIKWFNQVLILLKPKTSPGGPRNDCLKPLIIKIKESKTKKRFNPSGII